MIIFKKLEWGNMFSYGPKNSLNLQEHKVNQLVGANGNGKSSIPLILEECLFNKNSKGTKRQDVINRNSTDKSYWCNLEFSIDGQPYLIKVKRASTHKVTLLKGTVDISGHTATQTIDKIEELLGLDFKTFSQLVYQNSSSSLQFLTATDTNRKKFLIDLLSLERYVELFDKFKEAHKSAAEKLAAAETLNKSARTWLDKLSNEDLSQKTGVSVPAYPKELTVELVNKKAERLDIDNLNKKIQKNEQYKAMRKSLPEVDISLLVEQSNIDADIKELGSLEAAKASIELAKKKIASLPDKCPTCMQSVDPSFKAPYVSELVVSAAALTEKIKVLSSKIAAAQEHNAKVRKAKETIGEFERYSSLIDNTLPSTLKNKQAIETEIQELASRVDTILTAIKAAEVMNESVIKHNSRVATILEHMEEYKSKLKKSKDEMDALTDELSYLEVLKKAFSTNGLLAYKIESSVKDLETLTNFYLQELSGGRFQISYTISGDKLNVVITDNGKDITVEALSAGELARVTTSTLLAIRRLMTRMSKKTINLLFLDETIDTLDIDGKERLLEILCEEQDVNAFLVSHGFYHPLINRVMVIKEQNISRLEDG